MTHFGANSRTQLSRRLQTAGRQDLQGSFRARSCALAALAALSACAVPPNEPPSVAPVDAPSPVAVVEPAPEPVPAIPEPDVQDAAPAAPDAEAAIFVLGQEAEAALTQARLEARNAAIVTAFYELIFVEHRVADAFDRYGGDDYIQHSPGSPDGRAAVEAALTPYFEANPLARSEIKRVVAQGDLVVLHVHAKSNPVDRGRAVVEIFRVENGRVVEHWDVIQPIPASAENENSMF